jgi:hypothetical protein
VTSKIVVRVESIEELVVLNQVIEAAATSEVNNFTYFSAQIPKYQQQHGEGKGTNNNLNNLKYENLNFICGEVLSSERDSGFLILSSEFFVFRTCHSKHFKKLEIQNFNVFFSKNLFEPEKS